MSEQNPIYVMFEYEEALNKKKNFLLIEQNLLKIALTIKNYKLLRLEELKTKAKMQKTLREVLTNLTKLTNDLPKIKTPNVLKHHFEQYESVEEQKISPREKIKTSKEINEDEDIESQIREIQNKLKQLRI
ncbi:MAG: hypothetical protein Q7S56_01860 [Nanoarchaeota archaeon]|nr:hypothetical protein [Nanoarchaeota archaeon]